MLRALAMCGGARTENMPSEETLNPWRTTSSKKVYENEWIGVREDAVVRPDGLPGIYGVVHFKHVAVGVLAVEGDEVYLVGQYRYPLDAYSWEIPEGGCAGGEDPLEAARRELEEETGLRAEHWVGLGEAHLSNSVSDEYALWFLATDLTQGEQRPEGSERISVRKVTLACALAMALNGEITDALSLLAIMSYHLMRSFETTTMHGNAAG